MKILIAAFLALYALQTLADDRVTKPAVAEEAAALRGSVSNIPFNGAVGNYSSSTNMNGLATQFGSVNGNVLSNIGNSTPNAAPPPASSLMNSSINSVNGLRR